MRRRGSRVFGKPYYGPKTPAGDNHYTNLDTFQNVDLIVPENRTKARGWLTVLLNYNQSPLIRVRTEGLVVGENRPGASLPGQLKRGNFISAILECEGVAGLVVPSLSFFPVAIAFHICALCWKADRESTCILC